MLARRVIVVVAMTLLSIAARRVRRARATRRRCQCKCKLNVTTIRAGHSIHGTAILTNSSSKSILVQAWSMRPVALRRTGQQEVPYDPAVADVRLPELRHAQARCQSSTDHRVDEVTTFAEQGPQKGTIQGTALHQRRCARLPKGTYHVVVITNGLSEFAPYSSRIRVTLS